MRKASYPQWKQDPDEPIMLEDGRVLDPVTREVINQSPYGSDWLKMSEEEFCREHKQKAF